MLSCVDIRTLPPLDRDAVLALAIREQRGCALESIACDAPGARWSMFGIDPVFTLTHRGLDADPLESMARHCRPWSAGLPIAGLPFVGGWIGCLSYEAGGLIEKRAIPRWRHHPLPLAQWSLFDTLIVHDADSHTWYAACVDLPDRLRPPGRATAATRLSDLERLARDRLSQARRGPVVSIAARQEPAGRPLPAPPAGGRWLDEPGAYMDKVRRSLEYIRAGDIFQVNLARRFRAPLAADPLDLYRRLCLENPAAYSAYVPVDGGAVLSSSPELFLSLKDRVVETRPIKGTRQRGRSAADDARMASDLERCEKDRAELNMIVDLERNDLGRVCEYNTVRVVSEGDIERLPTVFHRTATIRGRLRCDCDALDLLRATFPGGSISGAPKVRAMQIIDELEDEPRGPYCGAIGFIGLDGSMMLNLPIRTLAVVGGQVEFSVGSGIVADSTPEDELCELDAKAVALLRALSGAADTPCAAAEEPRAADGPRAALAGVMP